MLAASVATGAVALKKSNQLAADCPDMVCDSPSYREDRDKVKALSVATDVMLATGAATVVSAVVWLIYKQRGKADEPEAGAWLDLDVGRHGARAKWTRRF